MYVLAPLAVSVVGVPAQTVVGFTATTGNGLTVIVKVCEGPGHIVLPLVLSGVTVIVAVIGLPVAFVAVKEILPVPVAGNPIVVLLLVQLNAFAFVPVKLTVPVEPTQKLRSGGGDIEGGGRIVSVAGIGSKLAAQPPLEYFARNLSPF